jgi:hypothetical protein
MFLKKQNENVNEGKRNKKKGDKGIIFSFPFYSYSFSFENLPCLLVPYDSMFVA